MHVVRRPRARVTRAHTGQECKCLLYAWGRHTAYSFSQDEFRSKICNFLKFSIVKGNKLMKRVIFTIYIYLPNLFAVSYFNLAREKKGHAIPKGPKGRTNNPFGRSWNAKTCELFIKLFLRSLRFYVQWLKIFWVKSRLFAKFIEHILCIQIN